jgi:hypothetical protein
MKTVKTSFFKFAMAAAIAGAIGFTIGSVGTCQLFHVGCPVPVPIDSQNFVPLDTAKKWVRNYDTIWKLVMDKFGHPKDSIPPLHYFTIRSQDVLCAMGIDTSWKSETKHRYIRISLGYSTALNQLKAFVQPVQDVDLTRPNPFAGKQLFFNKKGEVIDTAGNPVGKEHAIANRKTKHGDTDTLTLFVGDLNTPCPATCGN